MTMRRRAVQLDDSSLFVRASMSCQRRIVSGPFSHASFAK
jgi:hypothetical protein